MVKYVLSHYWEVLLICCLSVFAILPLFQPGFFSMHDDEQVGRVFELHHSLSSGNFPPRISQNLGFGYGYPFFNFYPSFVYYVAELFHIIGFSYIDAVKLMIGTGFLVAAIFMYLFAREYFGRIGGTVAAVAYTYAPYHAAEVYVRGALPEFWSFVFIPMIFWSLEKMHKTVQLRYMFVTAIGLACLIVTHNLIAMMSGVFIAIFTVYLLFTTKKKKHFFFLGIGSVILGLGLSAYFWIPSYFEKDATMVDLLTREAADYKLHFIYVRQLWNSPWGYGGSYGGIHDGMSFQVGKLHIILSAFCIFLIGYFYYAKKKINYFIGFFLGMFLLSLFLQTKYSKFIWDAFKPFWYIQFPWRFLVFSVFTSSVLVGSLFLITIKTSYKLILACIIIVILILETRSYFVPREYYLKATDLDYVAKDFIRWETSSLAFEYIPKGVVMKKNVFNNSVVDMTKADIAKSSYTIVKGDITVAVKEEKPQSKIFAINAVTKGELRINTFSFPGWKVYIDGKEVVYRDNNKLKLITISVPAGRHEIKAVFTDTIYRIAGNTFTSISILFILIWSFSSYVRYKIFKRR